MPGSPTSAAGPVTAAWARLESTGTVPAAREDHTWTVGGDGAVAYLFGGRAGGKSFDDLWAYDLAGDTWKRLDIAGEAPKARFGHTASWVPEVGLVVWSGQAGSDFFADLWAFDPLLSTWRELPSEGEVPAKRYGSCAALGPDGRLWISHGFTDTGRFFDTRAYDFGTGSWSDVTPADGQPVERCLHDCWWTSDGKLLLYAGQTDGVPALGDLWSLTPDEAGGATWQELATPEPRARQLYAQTLVGGQVYVFGGSGPDGRKLDDLWRLDPADLTWTELAPSETPAGRSGGTLVTDDARERVLLWGGRTDDGALDDGWQLTLTPAP